MMGCSLVTDAAFVHLKGILNLNMSGCSQATITDAAFVHLKGIHKLHMQHCSRATIKAAIVPHLAGIRVLYVLGAALQSLLLPALPSCLCLLRAR